jgi:uncharacterized RmlC-like cupin family protein
MPGMNDRVVVVRSTDFVTPPGPATAGVDRRQAIAREGRWIGVSTTDPGVLSGWHDHGANDTFFVVLRGAMRFEYGLGGREVAEASTGDFVWLGGDVVHREGTLGDEQAAALVFRIGEGPLVFPLDAPGARATSTPSIVHPADLRAAAVRAPGSTGLEAFETDRSWFGRVGNTAHQESLWHVHPNHDVYGYAVTGRYFADFGPGGRERAIAEPGDVIEIPRGVVHREGNPDDGTTDRIVLRVGSGEVIVTVDGPPEG